MYMYLIQALKYLSAFRGTPGIIIRPVLVFKGFPTVETLAGTFLPVIITALILLESFVSFTASVLNSVMIAIIIL